MKTIEERVQILEGNFASLQEAFLQSQSNQAITQGTVDESHNKIPQVDENTVGVSDNDLAICDIAEMVDTNSQAIDDLAELVDELLNGGN